jgi:hypothetical protein
VNTVTGYSVAFWTIRHRDRSTDGDGIIGTEMLVEEQLVKEKKRAAG